MRLQNSTFIHNPNKNDVSFNEAQFEEPAGYVKSARRSFEDPANDDHEYEDEKYEEEREDDTSSPATKYTDVNETMMHTEAKLNLDDP